ncbi:hypothetical protein C1645_840929 [Glomus cerebriforme]|uniref:Uncharacterized protein n=1 Tax=Glomus cerebriforme TaxID=658196 RepID=A0A397SAH5_9GLOM|nr:hypothetical protein C1645_840929 [Glomus cerebriforme]
MSNNRFNCHLHDHELIDTSSPPVQPNHSQLNFGFPKTVSSQRLGWTYAKSFPTFPRNSSNQRRVYYSHFTHDINPLLTSEDSLSARDKKFLFHQCRYYKKAETIKGASIITHLSNAIISRPSSHLGVRPPLYILRSPVPNSLAPSVLNAHMKLCFRLMMLDLALPFDACRSSIYKRMCFLYRIAPDNSALLLLSTLILSKMGHMDYTNFVFTPVKPADWSGSSYIPLYSQPLSKDFGFTRHRDSTIFLDLNGTYPFWMAPYLPDFSSYSLILCHLVLYLATEFTDNLSLSDSVKRSYLVCLRDIRDNVPPSLDAHKLVSEFLVPLDSSLLY